MQGLINLKICIGILLFGVISLGSCRNIHEDMTSDELIKTFYRDEDIPDYEVVPIKVSYKNKRDTASQLEIEFNSYGNRIEINHELVDGPLFTNETKIYNLYHKRSGHFILSEFTIPTFINDLKLYRNNKLSSVAAVKNDKIKWAHIDSKNLVIRPLPKRLVKNARRYARSADSMNGPELMDHSYHIVYKKNTSRIMERSVNSEKTKRETGYPKVSELVYPKVLIIADYSYFKLFDRRMDEFLLYLMAFWNGVDRIFESIENPKIRLNIAGIIIARNYDALSYIRDSRDENDVIDFEKAINNSAFWLYKFFSKYLNYDEYNIVVTLIPWNKEMLKIEGKENNTRGIAFLDSACKSKGFHKVYNSAIVSDSGGFDGVVIAAHELGHTFGAHHDGENNCFDTNKLMAPSMGRTPESTTWSKCNHRDFYKFFSNKTKCFSNKPKGTSWPRILPGQLQDANEQCLKRTGRPVFEINDEICYKLSCVISKEFIRLENGNIMEKTGNVLMTGAADGTRCGNNKICLHGQCLPKYKRDDEDNEILR